MSTSSSSKRRVPNLVKIFEVADYLRVSPQTVRKLIASGDLTAAKVGPSGCEREHMRIIRKSLLDFYQSRFGHSLERALAREEAQ